MNNLYLASIQKTGSQWMKKIFNDERVKGYTKLRQYPQHNYEYNEFHARFPEGTFVPGLYLSYQSYEIFVQKPERYRTIYIIRDPRNVAVSWYYSIKKTHPEIQGVREVRARLSQMSHDEGLMYSIRYLSDKFAFMRSWIELSAGDPNVKIVKFEDLTQHAYETFSEVFEFLKCPIPENELREILADHTKEKMREEDMKLRNTDDDSHYRVQESSYKIDFKEQHLRLFREVTGNLVELLGYENSNYVWQEIEYFAPEWENRVEYMASFIDSDDIRVCDMGCGEGKLRHKMPQGCSYIGVDYKMRPAVTYICDLNMGELPPVEALNDVVFCSGVMEYLTELDLFLKEVCAHAKKLIVSYCTLDDYPSHYSRRNLGWQNDLTLQELIDTVQGYGLKLIEQGKVQNNSVLYFKK